MNQMVIEINGLNKSYGNKAVLKDLSWSIEAGEVVALLGQNGAGKTTLLESIMNLKTKDSGDIKLFENSWDDLDSTRRQKIAFVAQDTHGFDWMSIKAYLSYLGSFYDDWDEEYAVDLCHRWRIDMKQAINALSGGQRQILRVIQALSTRPDLMILDEPVAHLDPNMRRAFLAELADLCTSQGTSIIFSSHIVSDLERIASRVALLKDGSIVCDYPLDELKEGIGQIRLSCESETLDVEGYALDNISDLVVRGSSAFGKLLEPLNNQAKEDWQAQGLNVEILPISLEDWYLAMTREESGDA